MAAVVSDPNVNIVLLVALKNDLVLKVELGSSRAKTEEIRPGASLVNQFLFLYVLRCAVIAHFCDLFGSQAFHL